MSLLRSVEFGEGGLVDCLFVWTVVPEAFSGAGVEVVVVVVNQGVSR